MGKGRQGDMHESIQFKDIVESLFEGVYCVDVHRRIFYWNKGAERISGYAPEEVVGRNCADSILSHIDDCGRSLCRGACPIVQVVESGRGHSEKRIYLHHKAGHRVPVSVSVSAIRDETGATIGAVEMFRECDAECYDTQYVEDLKRAALLDSLTELPNRRYIEMKLRASLEEHARHGTGFGVMFMDLDHFKRVNDTYGHEVGDRILKMIAATLRRNVRAYNLIGRWGGEEFVGIISHVTVGQMRVVAGKLRALVEQSFLTLGSGAVGVTATFGLAMAREGDTPESILRRADESLYEGKREGRNCVVCSERESDASGPIVQQ
jgi:diguanylate cyclase (GGDEF)-like protein/PAS domain S-box-containing protein